MFSIIFLITYIIKKIYKINNEKYIYKRKKHILGICFFYKYDYKNILYLKCDFTKKKVYKKNINIKKELPISSNYALNKLIYIYIYIY